MKIVLHKIQFKMFMIYLKNIGRELKKYQFSKKLFMIFVIYQIELFFLYYLRYNNPLDFYYYLNKVYLLNILI